MEVKLNPNKEIVDDICEKLKNNNGYCPCNLIKNPDTKCRCKEFRDQIARGQKGFCHCGLWYIE